MFFRLMVTALLVMLGGRGFAQINETRQVARIDGSLIDVQISRPQSGDKIPALIAVSGSLCIASTLSQWIKNLEPTKDSPFKYGLVIVEKPGAKHPVAKNGNIDIGPDFTCTEEFKTYYSIDQRIEDHLRVVQMLRRRAPWWNGELYIWGFSDGGHIGARLAAYTPETKRVVLGGFGGGIPMAIVLDDYAMCAGKEGKSRKACSLDLQNQYTKMRDNPTTKKSWLGEANTWKVWASRLDVVDTNVLYDLNVPLLVFHGEKDGSVHVQSARTLIEALQGTEGPDVRYWEIPKMGHGIHSLPEDEADHLQNALLEWLFTGRSNFEPPLP